LLIATPAFLFVAAVSNDSTLYGFLGQITVFWFPLWAIIAVWVTLMPRPYTVCAKESIRAPQLQTAGQDQRFNNRLQGGFKESLEKCRLWTWTHVPRTKAARMPFGSDLQNVPIPESRDRQYRIARRHASRHPPELRSLATSARATLDCRVPFTSS
jgi:hypothetical protein